MIKFPFPEPTYYQVREYPNGTTKTLAKSTALKYPAEDEVDKKWIAVYPGNSSHPDVRVRHPTLPELDFVDMIRAHVYELCRQCFIHNVPMNSAQRYIRLLIHRLTPFLEWKYTEGDFGRKDFWPEADRELRKIVTDLRAVHSRRSGRTPRLTHQLSEDRPDEVTTNTLEIQASDALAENKTKEMKQTIKTLRELISKKYITDYDANSLVDDALRITAVEGNRWHRVISNSGYQPNSLKEVVFYGDTHHRELSDILVVHEVPVTTPKGAGVADIVVFVRRVFGERVIWSPIMILDVKTKTQLDWTFYSKKPRTKKKETRVFVHDINSRPLSDEEWKSVLDCTPSSKHETQLEEYEIGIITGFEEIVHDKEIVPKSLWKGIIVLDTEESYEDIVPILPWLIKASLSDIESNSDDLNSRILYTIGFDDVSSQKVALILSSREGPFNLLANRDALPEVTIEDPFEQRQVDSRDLTLYLSVASPGSSGESAAWTARNWHLLEYLRQLSEQNNNSRIVWLDLMGFYPSVDLAMSRLRITGSLSPPGMPRKHLTNLRALIKKVEFVNLRDEVESLFFDDKRASLEKIQERVNSTFVDVDKNQIVIVDGWAELGNSNPHRFDTLKKILENRLLDWLPRKNVEVIWLDRPVSRPTRDLTYQRAEVSPLPFDSPRREHLDMIIWNKPTLPRFLGWRSPMLEYVRVIEHDTPTKAEPFSSLFVVPHLHGWGRRFRADSKDGRKLTDLDVMERVHGPKYARGKISSTGYSFVLENSNLENDILRESLELSPSILRPRSIDDTKSVEASSSQEPRITVKEMSKVGLSRGILDRLKLIPYGKPQQKKEDDEDSKQYYPAKEITRALIHKERKKPDPRKLWTRRPPLFVVPKDIRIGEREFRREVQRVCRTAEFLWNRIPVIQEDWRRLLNDVVATCKEERRNSVDVLEDIRKILAEKKESRDIWKSLVDVRKESINTTQKIGSSETALWELFGNDLYLLVLAIFHDDEIEIEISMFDILWSSISDWQFSNMGYIRHEQPDTHVSSKYDVSSIWSNLKWRAKQLGRIKPVIGVFEDYGFGLLVNIDHASSWLMIQTKSRKQSMIAGYSESFQWPFRWKWYECIADPFQLEEASDNSWESAVPIVITHSEGKDILWTPRMEEDEIIQWWAEGIFECGNPPDGRLFPIRWFRLSRIPDTLKSRLNQPEVIVPDNLEEIVNTTLRRMDGMSDNVKRVRCQVTLDVDNEMYQINFFGKTSRKKNPVFTLDVENTTELIQILRHPKLMGIPLNNELWWNPESDVKFVKVNTDNGPIDLTFLKPFTYRSRRGSEFLRNVTLPKNASDLLQTKLGDPITLVANPNLQQTEYSYAKYWRILFLHTNPTKRMLLLQDIDVSIIEIAQFFESKQFIDTTTGLKHPLRFAINNLKQVSFPDDVFRYDEIAGYLEDRDIIAADENNFEDSG